VYVLLHPFVMVLCVAVQISCLHVLVQWFLSLVMACDYGLVFVLVMVLGFVTAYVVMVYAFVMVHVVVKPHGFLIVYGSGKCSSPACIGRDRNILERLRRVSR